MDVGTIMTEHPVSAPSTLGCREALDLMDDKEVRHLPVLESGQLVGVVSDRDLLTCVGWYISPETEAVRSGSHVKDVMHRDVTTVSPDDTVVSACVSFQVERIGCLPVLDADGRLVGIVTEMDILEAYWKECRDKEVEGDIDPAISSRMTAHPNTLRKASTLRQAVEACRHMPGRHLPVVDEGRVAGIVSDRDLRAAAGSDQPEDLPITEVMTTDVATLPPDARLSRAAEIMGSESISALPIVDGDRLVGILTLTDLLEHCLDALREPERA